MSVDAVSSGNLDKLIPALIKARKEMPALAMDGYNPHYSSKFTTLGKIIEDTSPILAKYGLSISQFPISGEPYTVYEIVKEAEFRKRQTPVITGVVGIKTYLYHESGQFVASSCKIPINGYNIAQEAGKAITYLRRYAWASILGLYSDEDIDANSPDQQKQVVTNSKQQAPKNTEKQQRVRYAPEELRDAIWQYAEELGDATDIEQQSIVIHLSKACGNNDDLRHKVQKFLFGEESIKEADRKILSATYAWLKPHEVQDGWDIDAFAKQELNDVIDLVKGEK